MPHTVDIERQRQPPRVLGIIMFETGHRRYVAALLPELALESLYSTEEKSTSGYSGSAVKLSRQKSEIFK